MKVGGREVAPFVIGLGAIGVGYVVLQRFNPPEPEKVTEPGPAPLTGYAGGAPPGPVADQDPAAGVQAALEGFFAQFGQPSQVVNTAPSGSGLVFEDERAPAPPPRTAPAPPPKPTPVAPPKPTPVAPPKPIDWSAWRTRMLPPFARRS